MRILNIFNNPGQAIYDEIINLVEFAVGGIISTGIDAFLRATGLDDVARTRSITSSKKTSRCVGCVTPAATSAT